MTDVRLATYVEASQCIISHVSRSVEFDTRSREWPPMTEIAVMGLRPVNTGVIVLLVLFVCLEKMYNPPKVLIC